MEKKFTFYSFYSCLVMLFVLFVKVPSFTQTQPTLKSIPTITFQIGSLFKDHMVLQCDQPIPVWGKAVAGTTNGSVFSIVAQSITPDKKIVYKQIDGDSLYFHVFEPQLSKEPTAVIVFFFGGGWAGGTPKQFYQQSEYFASRGVLAIAAEYRTKSKHGTSPFACVEDGKSAIRWIREHHKELNIDPDKIVAAGGSAGGHIALCTALIKGLEHVNENTLISSVPNTVVAYNPVLDTTEKGYGHEKVIGREKEISPCHQVKNELPPMLLFHGKKDTTVPFENATRFTRLMKEAGNECELVAVDNAGHGFFNGKFFRKNARIKHYDLTIHETDVFLEKLGYL